MRLSDALRKPEAKELAFFIHICTAYQKKLMTWVLIFSQFDEMRAICRILNWPLKYNQGVIHEINSSETKSWRLNPSRVGGYIGMQCKQGVCKMT